MHYYLPLFGSLDSIRRALRRSSYLLSSDLDKVINPNVVFLRECGLGDCDIAKLSKDTLRCSLEGRLKPRYYVLKFLKENGLLDCDWSFYTAVTMSDKYFMKKCICPHQEAAPHLAEDYAAACRGEMPKKIAENDKSRVMKSTCTTRRLHVCTDNIGAIGGHQDKNVAIKRKERAATPSDDDFVHPPARVTKASKAANRKSKKE
ncbi:hypothetical protein ZWY2020_057709 [Hordeum vulgare]|nr:hypothetical protein ZWY2020_057709 [Hordeum vulgare]